MITDEQLNEWEVRCRKCQMSDEHNDPKCFDGEPHDWPEVFVPPELVAEVRQLREENKKREQDWHDVGKHHATTVNKLHDLLKRAEEELGKCRWLIHPDHPGLKIVDQLRSEIKGVIEG